MQQFYYRPAYEDYCLDPLKFYSFDKSILHQMRASRYDLDHDVGLLKEQLLPPLRYQARNMLAYTDQYNFNFYSHWSAPSRQNVNFD